MTFYYVLTKDRRTQKITQRGEFLDKRSAWLLARAWQKEDPMAIEVLLLRQLPI